MNIKYLQIFLICLLIGLQGCGGGGGGITGTPIIDSSQYIDINLSGRVLEEAQSTAPSQAPNSQNNAASISSGTVSFGGKTVVLDAKGEFQFSGRFLASGEHLLTVNSNARQLSRRVTMVNRQRSFLTFLISAVQNQSEFIQQDLFYEDDQIRLRSEGGKFDEITGATKNSEVKTKTLDLSSDDEIILTQMKDQISSLYQQTTISSLSLNNSEIFFVENTNEVALDTTVSLQLVIDKKQLILTEKTPFSVFRLAGGETTEVTTTAGFAITPSTLLLKETNQIRGQSVGIAAVKAVYEGISSPLVNVTVVDPTPATLQLEVTPLQLQVGQSQQLKVTAVYDNFFSRDVTLNSVISGLTALPFSRPSTTVLIPGKSGIYQWKASFNGLESNVVSTTVENTLQSIAIQTATATVALGESLPVKTIASFLDNTTAEVAAAYTTTGADVQIADSVIQFIQSGAVTIEAEFQGKITTKTITVTIKKLAEVVLQLPITILPVGGVTSFSVLGRYSDGSEEDLTTTAILTMSSTLLARNDAQLQALQMGNLQLSATVNNVTSLATTFTVLAAQPEGIQLETDSLSIALGKTTGFRVWHLFPDGSKTDVTAMANLTDNAAILTFNNGLVKGLSEGITSITAQVGTFTSNALIFTVSPKTASSLVLTANQISLPLGGESGYEVSLQFSDGSKLDVTNSAELQFGSPIVSILNGKVKALSVGSTTITATHLGINSLPLPFAVTAKVPSSLEIIVSAGASYALGTNGSFSAILHYSDGSTQNVTNEATYQIDVAGIVSLNSMLGQIATQQIGAASISATYSGIAASAVLVTVTAPSLNQINLDFVQGGIYLSDTATAVVTAEYTDGSTADVTLLSTITALTPTDAAIVGAVITPQVTGNLNFQADFGGQQKTAVLEVTPVPPPYTVTVVLTIDNTTLPIGRTTAWSVEATDNHGANSTVAANLIFSDGTLLSENGGILTAQNQGTVFVQAEWEGVRSNLVEVTTQAPVVDSLTLASYTEEEPVGVMIQPQVTALWSDGSTTNVTTGLSHQFSVAGIVGVVGTELRCLSAGITVVTIEYQGVQASPLTITVTPAQVVSLHLNVTSTTLTHGESTPVQVIALYTSGATAEVTGSVSYPISGTGVLNYSNGALLATRPGNVTINAEFSGVTSNTESLTIASLYQEIIPVNVSSSALDVLAIMNQPLKPEIQLGETKPYIFSDVANSTASVTLHSFSGLKSQMNYKYQMVILGNSGAVVDDNAGVGYSISTTKIGIGATTILTGRFLSSGTPVAGGIVLLGRVNHHYLAAITDNNGYWFVNLANFKTLTGDVASISAGTIFTIRQFTTDGTEVPYNYTWLGISPEEIP